MSNSKLLVIIPAYNEEENLEKLINELIFRGYDYLVINDCSTDGTEQLLLDNEYNHLSLPINMGIAGVTQIGFKYAKDFDYDASIVIDGDGQHLPEYIAVLEEKMNEGYDYVIGSRFANVKKPWNARMLGSRLISLLLKITTGKTITDPTSGMRMMGKKVIADFSEHLNFVAEPDAVAYLLKSKYKVVEVQVEMKDREFGVSYFASPLKSIKFMYKVLVSILFVQKVR